MQGRGNVKPPTGVTFDSDFGNTIDSVLTLALLRAIASKGDSRVIAVSIGQESNIKAAQAEEGFSNFYSGTPLGGSGRGVIAGFGGGGGGVGVNPVLVGLATNGKYANDTPIIDALLAKKTEDGKTAYPSALARTLRDCGLQCF